MSTFNYDFIINQVNEYDSRTYSFLIKSVLRKSEVPVENYNLIFGTIEPILSVNLLNFKEEKIEYDIIVYHSKLITKEELIELLTVYYASTMDFDKLHKKITISESSKKTLQSESKILTIKDELKINLNSLAKTDRIDFQEYDTTLGSRHTDSHTGYYIIDFSRQKINLQINNNFISFENPYYTDIYDLILEKFSYDLIRFNALNGQLLLRIPQSFMGEIERIDFIDDQIYYKVRLLKNKKSILKIYIKDRAKNLGKSFSIPINKSKVEDSLTVPFEPNWLDAILIDEKSNVIHKITKSKIFHDDLSRKPEAIERRILNGEGLTCDFKEELPAKAKVIKLLCAFANTEGGDIIIGVDNNANIIGITYQINQFPENFDKIESHIQNLIDDYIDPPIKVEGFTVILKDKNGNDCEIGVLRVKESPLLVKNPNDNELYIRRGSTKRIAQSIELNELIRNKISKTYL